MGLLKFIASPYKFTLESTLRTVICKPLPIQWKEGVTKLSRDKDSAGVFNSYVISELTFVGNGAKLLKELYAAKEIDATCTLTISKFDFPTMSYVDFPTKYQLDFGSYKIVKVGKFSIGVNISCSDSSILSKWNDRKKTNIDITKLLSVGGKNSMGGMEISDYNDSEMLSKVYIPVMKNYFMAKLEKMFKGYTGEGNFAYALSEGYNSIPLNIINNSFEETQYVPFEYGQPALSNLDAFFYEAKEDKTVTINYSISVFVNERPLIQTYEPLEIYIAKTDTTGVATEQLIRKFGYHENRVETYGSINDGWQFGSDGTITAGVGAGKNEFVRIGIINDLPAYTFNLLVGESLKIYIKHRPVEGLYAYFVNAFVEISEESVATTATTVDGFDIYHALERMAQMTLDDQWAFYSEFFAKNEFYCDASTQYSSIVGFAEDEKRMAHIFSGLNLRGLSITKYDGKINIDPEKFLRSISSMYCIGWSFETILGRSRLRVENRAFFFQDLELVFDPPIKDRINNYDIISEYLPEMAYLEIEYGFENFTFNSVNGRSEFCTKCTRTTQLSANEKLNLVSEIVAAPTSIINCLEKPIGTYGSEDMEEDSKVFILKTQRDESEPTLRTWKMETNEIITIDNNSSPYGASTPNLFFQPVRNLVRNAELFMPALRLQESGYLRFQTTDKLSGLETTSVVTGEDYSIKESDDIRIGGTDSILPAARMKPIKHMTDVLFTYKDMNLILATDSNGIPNRYKYIKLSDTRSIWLYGDGIMMKIGEDKASITGIEKI